MNKKDVIDEIYNRIHQHQNWIADKSKFVYEEGIEGDLAKEVTMAITRQKIDEQKFLNELLIEILK